MALELLGGGGGGGGTTLVPTVVKTAAYTAANLDDVVCDTHAGGWLGTLPSAVVANRVRWTNVTSVATFPSAGPVTLGGAGSDVINLPPSQLPATVNPGESVELHCFATGLWSLV